MVDLQITLVLAHITSHRHLINISGYATAVHNFILLQQRGKFKSL